MATQPSPYAPKYTPELAADIVERISRGENLRAITRDSDVTWVSFYRWLRNDPQLQADYEEARILGAHAIAHDALALLEQQPERVDKRIDPGFVQWQRLKIEGTLKILAKWFPQHYGDKLLHAGHDGGAIKSETALSVKELAAQLRARASGLTIDGDAKEVLTDASTRFNATSVSNEGQTDALPSQLAPPQPERKQSRKGTGAEPVPSTQPGVGRGRAALAADALHDGGSATGVEPRAQSAAAGADGSVPGARQQKARSRGVGDRGGGQKRGASPEMGGTPAPRIFEKNPTEPLSTACFPSDDDWDPEDYV